MPSWRDRESAKQANLREQNDSKARGPAGGEAPFRCECGDAECTTAITLSRAEYAVVRAYATQFAVARHHENPESEQVVEENDRFAIVETVTRDATRLARRSEPGQRRRERRWRGAEPPFG